MRLDPAERYESAEAMAAALLGEEAERTDETTATIAAPVTAPLPRSEPDREPVAESDENETVPVPRMEQTARLQVQTPAPRPAGPRRPSKVALIIAGAILAVVVITVLALAAFTGPAAPGPSGVARSSLPTPLDEALTRLEESVRP